MKSPFTGKEMRVIKEWRDMTFRKEVFPVLFHYFVCDETGEQFEDEHFAALNYNQAINQYRVKHRIPFAEQISEIRAKYKLSASKMSDILGLGTNSWRNYEAGEVPSKANAGIIQMISKPETFREFVMKYSELEEGERNTILKHVHKLAEHTDWLCNPLFCFDIQPDITTGFKMFNREKTSQIVLYFAQRQQPYKTKMNKLLFYADFLHFGNNGEGISGLRYKAIQHGPVPNNYELLFNSLTEKGIIETDYVLTDNGELERFYPGAGVNFNPSVFSASELETLDYIVSRFKNTSAGEIVKISHNESAWHHNIDGKKIIPYYYAFQLETV